MSLKNFHLVFILAGIFILLMFPAWIFFLEPQAAKDLQSTGIISLMLGATLIVYGVWFLTKKSARIII